jgi:ankyrin repeat protein
LQAALARKSFDTVLFLLQQGAPISGVDGTGWSCLHTAAFVDHKDCAELILKRMTEEERNAKDDQGWTALDLASFYKHEGVWKLLHQGGEVRYAWQQKREGIYEKVKNGLVAALPPGLLGVMFAPGQIPGAPDSSNIPGQLPGIPGASNIPGLLPRIPGSTSAPIELM